MAYVTGTANNLAALLAAYQAACTANGWTLSGNVLHKGTCFVEVVHAPKGAHADLGLIGIRPGNGKDGSNNLTDAPPQYSTNWPSGGAMGPLGTGSSTSVYTDWDWPVTYHIHVLTAPDEVYMMVNYGLGQYWQGISHGQSPAYGCLGTGNWAWGSQHRQSADTGTSGRLRGENYHTTSPAGSALNSYYGWTSTGAAPFWVNAKDESSSVPAQGQFHGCINTAGDVVWSHVRYYWNNAATAGNAVVSASRAVQPLPVYSPNAWNNEAHLIRWQIMQPRPEWKTSIIGELQHLRFCRNDFIDDGEVLTIGPDRWKVYPFIRKDITKRDGGGGYHSGTSAMAIRYDGP